MNKLNNFLPLLGVIVSSIIGIQFLIDFFQGKPTELSLNSTLLFGIMFCIMGVNEFLEFLNRRKMK